MTDELGRDGNTYTFGAKCGGMGVVSVNGHDTSDITAALENGAVARCVEINIDENNLPDPKELENLLKADPPQM